MVPQEVLRLLGDVVCVFEEVLRVSEKVQGVFHEIMWFLVSVMRPGGLEEVLEIL